MIILECVYLALRYIKINWKCVSRTSLRLATKYYFGVKKIRKISISDAKILKQKRRNATEVIHKVSIVLIALSAFCYIFSESECTRFTESSHNWSF